MDLVASYVVLMACAVAFCAFVGRRRRGGGACPADVVHPRRTGSLPGLLVDFGYWLCTPAIRFFRLLHLTPNTISAASLPVSVVAAILLARGHFGLGAVAMLIAVGFDACDGLLARETGVASAAGEFIDATVDRYNDLIILLGMLHYYRDDLVPSVLAATALVGTSVVSYTRAKGEALGVDPNLGWMQRQERSVYLGVGALSAPLLAALVEGRAEHPQHYLVLASLAAVTVGTHITVIARSRHVVSALRARDEPPAEDEGQAVLWSP